MASPDFWNNRENAQSDVQLVSELRSKIQPFQTLESRAADLAVLKELAAEESPDQEPGLSNDSCRRRRHGILRLGRDASANVFALD